LVDDRAAVGGDDFECGRVRFQEARDEVAAAVFKVLEHTDFIGKTFGGLVSAESLVDPAIKTDADDGALGVFDLMHGDWTVRVRATGREARGKHDVRGPGVRGKLEP
jgi:hypothetical protein